MGLFSAYPGRILYSYFQIRLQEYYAEAARRLPLKEVDDLADCINEGGLCLGLADPVSNIILNAVGLLVHRELARHKKPPTKFSFSWHSAGASIEAAKMSDQSDAGQLVFMIGYFRHLNRTQARSFLDLASSDLALAINLVRHNRQQTPPLLPDGGRTKSALRAAAIAARHPEPDVLARLMTAQYPSDLLSAVLTKLQGTELLSADDLSQVKDLLTRQWPQPTPPPVDMHLWCHPDNPLSGSYCNRTDDGSLLISTGIGQDRVAEIRIRTIKDQSCFPEDKQHISGLTFNSDGMKGRLSKCLATPVTGEEERKTFLKLRLIDTIHAFYIKALARLPICQDPELLRAILVAGHCYGPMDPVSNIIINSCWYHMAFPLRNQVKDLDLPHLTLPGCFDEDAHLCSLPLPYCIIDTRSISRLAIRSLDGLIAALRDGASMSLLQALEFLTTTDCDISRAVLHPTVFVDAAKEAKHPQYIELGSFLSNPLYQKDKVILYGLSQLQFDSYPMVTQHLCKILPRISHQKDEAPLCKLTQTAAGKIINRKYFVREMLRFLGAKLDKVLHEYHYQHPWEPSFQLDVICGVNEPSPNGGLHHVNFLASLCGAEAVSGRTLFFAELWNESVPGKSSSCSPVYDYIECIGRCSFCEKKRSKIIHPPSGGYFGDLDGSLDIDGSHGWLDSEDKSSEGLLLTDYVYFDPARDHDLGQALNHFHG